MAEAEQKSFYQKLAEQQARKIAPQPSEPAPESAAPLAPTDSPSPTEKQARAEDTLFPAPTTEPVESLTERPEVYKRKPGEDLYPDIQAKETPAGPSYVPHWSPTGAKYMSETKDIHTKYLLAEQTHPGRELMPPSELDSAAEPEPLGTLFSVLHTFDIPRTAAWLAAYKSEAFLPDPTVEGEEPTTASSMGDAAQWAAGKVAAAALGFYFEDVELAEGEKDPFEQIGENIYKAFATGELYDKAMKQQVAMYTGKKGLPWVDLIGEEGIAMPYPKGVDFLNSVVPIDVARKIASTQTGVSFIGKPVPVPRKIVWDMLASDAGREWLGVAMEIAADPLWFAGPAGGAVKTVSKSNKVIEVSRPLVKMSGAAQDLLGKNSDEMLGIVVDAVYAKPAAKKEAVKVFKKTFKDANELSGIRIDEVGKRIERLESGIANPARAAKAAQDEAARAARELDDLMADYTAKNLSNKVKVAQEAKTTLAAEAAKFGTSPESASKYLKKQLSIAKKESRVYKRQGDLLYHGQTLLADGLKNGLMKEKGRIAVHIPFGTKTYYPGTAVAQKVRQVMPEPLIAHVGKASDYLKPMNPAALKKAAMEGATLNRAQTVAVSAYETTAHAAAVPAMAFDKLARMFGTRFYQPLLGKYQLSAEVGQYAVRRGMLSVPVLRDKWVFAKKVAPAEWHTTQNAIEAFNRRVVSMEASLTQSSNRMAARAADTYKLRQAEAKKELNGVTSEVNRLESIVRSATGDELLVAKARLKQAKKQKALYEGWLKPSYTIENVIFEAFDEYEAGVRFAKENPHLVQRPQGAVEELIGEITAEFNAELADDANRVRQALFNLKAKMTGSVEQKDAIVKNIAEVKAAYLELKGHQARFHAEAIVMAQALRTRVGAMRQLVQKVGAKDLAMALERVRLGVGGKGYDTLIHEQFVENVLMDVFRDARVVDDILNKAATIMDEADRGAAISALVKKLSTKLKKGEVSASKILSDSIKQTLNEMLRHDELIHKASIGDFSKAEEVEVMTALLDAQFGIHVGKMKGIIGDDLLPHFLEWADKGDFKTGWTKRFEQSLRDQGVHPSQRPPTKLAGIKVVDDAKDKNPIRALEEDRFHLTDEDYANVLYGKTSLEEFLEKRPQIKLAETQRLPPIPGSGLSKGYKYDCFVHAELRSVQLKGAKSYDDIDWKPVGIDGATSDPRKGTEIPWSEAKQGDWVRWPDMEGHYGIVIDPERRIVESAWGVDGKVFQHPVDYAPYSGRAKVFPVRLKAAKTPKAIEAAAVLPSPGSLGKAAALYKKARAVGEAAHSLGQAGATAKARGVEGGLIRLTKRGEISPVSKELGKTGMLTRRLENLVGDAKSEKEAVAKAKAALEDILPSDEVYEKAIIDEMAERIGRGMFERVQVRKKPGVMAIDDLAAPERLVKDAKAKALEYLQVQNKLDEIKLKRAKGERAKILKDARVKRDAEIARLEKEEKKVTPKITSRGGASRSLEEWEMELVRRFHELPEVKNLSDDEMLYAAATALKEMPSLGADEATQGWIKGIEKAYPQAVGARFMDETKDLELVIDELADLFRSYEEMYKEKGWKFVKEPAAMLRDWGVLEYVPHIADKDVLQALGKGSTAKLNDEAINDLSRAGGAGMRDARLSITMDATKKRKIHGTIKEINASSSGNSELTICPNVIVARYMQANRAISSSEMLYTLKSGGVIRAIKAKPGPGGSVAEQAALEDLVPLFGRPSAERDFELLMVGDIKALEAAGVTAEELKKIIERMAQWRKGIKHGEKVSDISPVASWLKQAPEAKSIMNTKESMLMLRQDELHAHELGKAVSLTNPKQMLEKVLVDPKHQQRITDAVLAAQKKASREAKARGYTKVERVSYISKRTQEAKAMEPWNIVAEGINSKLPSLAKKVNGDGLLLTYGGTIEPGAWALYVPRGVVTALDDVLDLKSVKGEGTAFKEIMDKVNNHWKARVTIIAIAFHSRNAVSNTFTNMLDVGVGGALNPKTNFLASRMSHAVFFHEKYGSLAKAKEILTAPKGTYESKADFAARKAERASFATVQRWVDEGLDLGDGINRNMDEVLSAMRDKGVISGAGTQYVDMNRHESNVTELMTNKINGKKYLAKKVVSAMEDIAVVGGTMLISGGLPVAVPKKVGMATGRFIENQARISNFIANFKRSGNFDEATKHAAKFLFDYGDLTAFQKVWMRSIFPFFTWNAKNVQLQLEMMQRSPVFYSMMNHAFADGIPRALSALDRPEGEPILLPPTLKEQRQRMSHVQSMIRIPIPQWLNVVPEWVEEKVKGTVLESRAVPEIIRSTWEGRIPDNMYVEGFGLPIEGFTEMMGLGSSVMRLPESVTRGLSTDAWDKRPELRVMSMAHPVARLMAEHVSKRHLHYDRPIKDLNNGRLIGQTVAALETVSPDAAEAVRHLTEFSTSEETSYDGTKRIVPVVNGYAGWLFGHLPWSRSVRDASALSDAYHMSLAYTAEETAATELRPVPAFIRILDALSGIRSMQIAYGLEARVYEKRKGKRYDDYLKERRKVRISERIYPVR